MVPLPASTHWSQPVNGEFHGCSTAEPSWSHLLPGPRRCQATLTSAWQTVWRSRCQTLPPCQAQHLGVDPRTEPGAQNQAEGEDLGNSLQE